MDESFLRGIVIGSDKDRDRCLESSLFVADEIGSCIDGTHGVTSLGNSE